MFSYFPTFDGATHKEKILLSLLYSCIAILALSSVMAFFTNENLSLVFTVGAIPFNLYALISYKKSRNYQFASLILLWIASVMIFAHIIINHFSIDAVLTIFIPIIASLLLSRKNLIVHGVIFFTILAGIVVYGYFTYPQHPFFNDEILISSFVIVIVFSITFSAIYHIFIEHSYQELESSNRQKEILLQEVHHRVKNNLNMMSSILGLQGNSSDKKTLEIIQSNRRRIESIAIVHELLYDSKNFANIDFLQYAKKLSQHLIHACSPYNIKVNIDANNIDFSLDTMAHIGLLLQELLTNSLKHAFSNAKDAQIDISLTQTDKEYILKYSDNGDKKQTPSDKETLGLELIELKVKQLDGKIELDKDDKYAYTISFSDAQK